MQFSQQDKCNKKIYPCPTSWAIPRFNGSMDLQNQPHGIVLTGHLASRNRLVIIPKEEFRAFWIASFSVREEPMWQNQVFAGTPTTIKNREDAAKMPCIIFENGKFSEEEEFTLEQTVTRLFWNWHTKIQIQNSSIMDIHKWNANGKHIDCGCHGAHVSYIGKIREHGTITVVNEQLARETKNGFRKQN
jgi:hypothetical protein